ncbi:MAG: hypothetical protein M3Q07_29170 [Pseudobdellovibrionaceae bacterium]|nr:hypothetical protein [Pseudobdellovibrionaceae bacterium]
MMKREDVRQTLNILAAIGLLLLSAEAFAQGTDAIEEIRGYVKAGIVALTSLLLAVNGGIVAAGWLFKVDFLKEWTKEHLQGMVVVVIVAGLSLTLSNQLSTVLTKVPSLWGG